MRVAIDWALDVLFTKDFVQYLDQRALAHTQTETGAAPWNRDQLSDLHNHNTGIAAEEPVGAHEGGSTSIRATR